MAVTAKLYGLTYATLADAQIDWAADTIKCALLDSGYAPNQDTHDFFDDVSAEEVAGSGYVAGGVTLANRSVAYDAGTNEVRLLADDAQWDPSTITARFAVIYKDTGNPATSPLISYVDFGQDRISEGALFEIAWASGVVAKTTLS